MARDIEVQVGALDSAAVTSPAASASVIGSLKGLLKQLQGGGTGAAPMTLTGSALSKTQPVYGQSVSSLAMSTIVSAVSVPAGGDTGEVSMGLDGTESLVLVAINIDQQPWQAYARNIYTGYESYTLYPARFGTDQTSAYPNSYIPGRSIYVPIGINISSLQEALLAAFGSGYPTAAGTSIIKVINKSDSTATVTVKITRIWR